MLASTLISSDIFPLKKTDTCEGALMFMQDWKVSHLPVVFDGRLLGYVSANKLADESPEDRIESFIAPLVDLKLSQTQHVFEVLSMMVEAGLSCLAVCDEQQIYVGSVSVNEVLGHLAGSSLSQPGAIIVLQMNPQDYSLAELSRIIEYNDCKILNVFVHANTLSPAHILVSLKLNKQTVSSVIQTLERYQYQIFSVHQLETTDANLDKRYSWLLKYLNT
jgi:predicted transcriptional regulator